MLAIGTTWWIFLENDTTSSTWFLSRGNSSRRNGAIRYEQGNTSWQIGTTWYRFPRKGMASTISHVLPWRLDHTGGSRLTPTVLLCPLRLDGLWVLYSTQRVCVVRTICDSNIVAEHERTTSCDTSVKSLIKCEVGEIKERVCCGNIKSNGEITWASNVRNLTSKIKESVDLTCKRRGTREYDGARLDSSVDRMTQCFDDTCEEAGTVWNPTKCPQSQVLQRVPGTRTHAIVCFRANDRSWISNLPSATRDR